jgi:hypothetical protein
MKPIKSMQQLREQQRALADRRNRLEQDIRLHWSELKEQLHPSNIAKESIDHLLTDSTKESGGSIVKNTVQYGLMLLAQKLSNKAAEQINKGFNKYFS